MASQSEITRKLEKSSLENNEPDGENKGFLSRSGISHEEHPLSLGKSSIWNQFFQVLNFYLELKDDYTLSLILRARYKTGHIFELKIWHVKFKSQ